MSYQERALAIIDRLTDSKAINIRERGTLRRAILLPEKTQGEWVYVATPSGTRLKCNKCKHFINMGDDKNFCPNCGCSMQESNKAEKEAYEEARREAMRLDDNEDTYKYRGHC